MRPNTAALIRSYPCKCGNAHEAKVMVHGIPVLVCPEAKGDMLRLAFGKDNMPYLRVGEMKEGRTDRR